MDDSYLIDLYRERIEKHMTTVLGVPIEVKAFSLMFDASFLHRNYLVKALHIWATAQQSRFAIEGSLPFSLNHSVSGNQAKHRHTGDIVW